MPEPSVRRTRSGWGQRGRHTGAGGARCARANGERAPRMALPTRRALLAAWRQWTSWPRSPLRIHATSGRPGPRSHAGARRDGHAERPARTRAAATACQIAEEGTSVAGEGGPRKRCVPKEGGRVWGDGGHRVNGAGRRWKPVPPQLGRALASPPGRGEASCPPVFMPERSWRGAPSQPRSCDSSGHPELESSPGHPERSAHRFTARCEHGKYDFTERLWNCAGGHQLHSTGRCNSCYEVDGRRR